MKNSKAAYLLLLPGIIFFILFVGWPLVEVVRLSFLKTNFITSEYVGLMNYVTSFRDTAFLTSIANNGLYMILYTAGTVILTIAVCLTVFNMPKRWHDSIRFVVYVPIISSGVILSQFWKYLFHIEGPINWIITMCGLEPVAFFQNSSVGIPVISFILVIQIFGIYVIILLSNMLSIDINLFDAAKIDGASQGQINRLIILPLMKKPIGMMVLLTMIGSLGVIETIMMLAPYEHTATITYHIFVTAFQVGKYGPACAKAILLFAMTIIITLVKNKVEKNG